MKYDDLPLGKNTDYIDTYAPELLRTIPRINNRKLLGINSDSLPFQGVDVWNTYELSWLDLLGKPVVAIAEIAYSCQSPCIIESKSLKLYLNSFNQTAFESNGKVLATLQKDLSSLVGMPVDIKFFPNSSGMDSNGFEGVCLDDLKVEITDYQVNPDLLKNTSTTGVIAESVFSHLLKSNCPITCQPDWASVYISYQGRPIDHEALLKYIVSYRKHNEFHEQTVERIFMDILDRCKPDKLTVYARYVRRGGIDINPFRSNFEKLDENYRQFRQ